MSKAVLVAHSGAEKLTRAELALVEPTHEPTRTFRPIKHIDLIETLDSVLAHKGIVATREEFAVGKKGAMIFGVMDLQMTNIEGVTAALGIRAANDRSMSVQVIIGARVFVCDNLAFSSDGIALKKKHTSGLDIRTEMVSAVDSFENRYLTMESQILKLQQRELTDQEAKALMLDSFAQEMLPKQFLPDVVKNYFEPLHAEFAPRTAWSLHNAYTETFKKMPAIPAQRSNMKVSRMLGLTSTTGVTA